MKTMTIGSDLKVNDKGSPLLCKHHAVDVEDAGSGVRRAVVKDQLFIDHLLIKDMIDVHQHMEAERVINLAVSAQVYLKSPSMDSISHGGGQPDMLSSGLIRYAGYIKWVVKKFGHEGERVIITHVVDDVYTTDFALISLIAKILKRK